MSSETVLKQESWRGDGVLYFEFDAQASFRLSVPAAGRGKGEDVSGWGAARREIRVAGSPMP